jgi:hypothetical protein
MQVQCHNAVNGFGAANSESRHYPANPKGADRHDRLDERRSGGISLRSVAGD